MVYKNLRFPALKDRPYFYTNFVSTVDGKVQVNTSPYAYWPIGSKVDYQTLIELRAYADVLIHGKNTAMWMRHVDNLVKPEFLNLRTRLKNPSSLRGGRTKQSIQRDLAYMVLSNHPDDKLLENIQHPSGNTFLITSESSLAPNIPNTPNHPNVLSFGEKEINLKSFSGYLFKNGYKNVLIEGGPSLLGSFLTQGFLDEVFLTISPKIFGNENNQTLTMVEGHLFPADKIKNLELISCKQVKDEVYLRYKVI